MAQEVPILHDAFIQYEHNATNINTWERPLFINSYPSRVSRLHPKEDQPTLSRGVSPPMARHDNSPDDVLLLGVLISMPSVDRNMSGALPECGFGATTLLLTECV